MIRHLKQGNPAAPAATADARVRGCKVSYCEESIGAHHTLPYDKTTRGTGGPRVGKSIEASTRQRIAREAPAQVGESRPRLCAPEDFMGHEEQADIRLRRHGSTQAQAQQRA